MTIQVAATILERLGPCRIAIDQSVVPELAQELALMGCALIDVPAPKAFRPMPGQTAGFLVWTDADTGAALAHALAPFAGMESLVLYSAGQARHGLEAALFAAGWQRHAGGMTFHDYGGWTQYALPPLSFYQRARAGEAGALRSSSVEADALIARYAMAASHVRTGDHVLIDGPGADDGAQIIAALSRAGRIEKAGFDLNRIADHTVDLIVAFEPFSGQDWVEKLHIYAQKLSFDGRLVIGCRRAQGGNDRPADWDILVEAVSDAFLPEQRYLHGPASLDPGGAQALYAVPLEQEADIDWLILTATANPLEGEGRGERYDHPAYPKAGGPWPALVDFAAAYDNPYLYRAMVQMGERLGHDVKLARLAECVIEDSRPDSADRGAALAVLGYRVLEMRMGEAAPALLPLMTDYLALPLDEATPAHVRRWRISLAFLAGRLNELIGERAQAKHWYRHAADAEWEGFSPLLTTKSIAAAFYEARLHLADGDLTAAKTCFRQGFDTALKAVAFPHEQQTGPADHPLAFYMQELAEVVDMGSQCANALSYLPLFERDPGLFWRQVDVRRFGLATWARDMERENERLRAG